MSALNRSVVQPGNQLTLVLQVTDSFGDLVDAAGAVVWYVYGPDLSLLTQGTGVHDSTGFYTATFAIPQSATPSRDWKITWNYNVSSQALVFEEFFTVLAGDITPASSLVTVDSSVLNRIQAVLGYPSVCEGVELSPEQIKEFCVTPALEIYFAKFPLSDIAQFGISGNLTVPFPNDRTFGALDVRVINKVAGQSQQASSNFFQIYAYQRSGASYGRKPWDRGGYGSGYDFNGLGQLGRMTMAVNQTTNNELGTFKHYIDTQRRQIVSYSSIQAIMEVEWASLSYNFADVQFTKKNDVIKIAQYYLLYQLIDLGSMLTTDDVPFRINIDALKERADKLYTEIKEKWDSWGFALALR